MGERIARIGPTVIADVPASDFDSWPLPLERIWQLCGPSAERNLASLPLWQVIAMAYVEGLQHGSAATRATQQPPQQEGES